MPKNINSEDLFYKRTYNEYVKKKFDVRRLGYLHMIYFKSNMTFFGEWGCKKKILNKYDYLMNIDDDSLFKKHSFVCKHLKCSSQIPNPYVKFYMSDLKSRLRM